MSTQPNEREAFEARFTRPPYEFSMDRWPEDANRSAWPGNYCSYAVQCAWEGWREARAALSTPPAAAQPAIELNIIRKWPEGFDARLQHVWKDVISFIPNVKLYDLQRVLAEFGFEMTVRESVAAALQGDGNG